MMCATQRYVGMKTPFGVIVEVEPFLYNPECVVRAKDGSTSRYWLLFLLAMKLKHPCSTNHLSNKKFSSCLELGPSDN